VNYTHIAPRTVKWKPIREIGLWDWIAESKRNQQLMVETLYSGPMVSGVLKYNIEDLKNLKCERKDLILT
jgi:hypothetical protein